MKGNKMFDNICVLGTGALAKSCCRILSEKGREVILYDTNEEPSWYLKRQCEKIEGTGYRFFDRKGTFADIAALKGKILIISATNPYIIPAVITDNPEVTAINLHHALLPAHPGRNAEAWTIYEEDEYGGITWHFVTSTVDGGDIICRKSIKLSDDITSWKLLKLQNDLAIEAFSGFADELMAGKLKGTKQEQSNSRLHYSYEKPGDGVLDPDLPAKRISAFLRSMDYGPVKCMGDPRMIIDGKEKVITGYTINKEEKDAEGDMIITGDGITISLKLADGNGE